MSVWTAFLPLIGLVVGAILQYWLSRASESRKQLELLQSQAYIDYLKAATKAAHADSKTAILSAQAEATDAKTRLAVYGSSEVIAALARFEEAGAVLDNPKALETFISLVGAMRQRDPATGSDLRLVLFGKQRDPLRNASLDP